MFLVSLCKAYWQVLLCQGIGIGIGIGLVYLPSISIISQYFSKRRALAIGIALTGSSGGGIVFPIMLNNLIISHGFKKAVQYQGYLVLGFLILSNLLMRPRPVPKERQTTTAVAIPTSSVKKIITEKPYALLVMSICLITWGFFFPPFFLQVRLKVGEETKLINPALRETEQYRSKYRKIHYRDPKRGFSRWTNHSQFPRRSFWTHQHPHHHVLCGGNRRIRDFRSLISSRPDYRDGVIWDLSRSVRFFDTACYNEDI